jgi:CRP-like cAMP-binding protein
MATVDVLGKVELFEELDKEDLERLAKVTVSREYKAGDTIVEEGELGVAFYIVAAGKVEVVKGLGTAAETVVATMGPGQFFGEMALFDNQVRSASVRAAEDTECLVLTKWDFNAELKETDGRIALTMLSLLARRIRAMTDAASH